MAGCLNRARPQSPRITTIVRAVPELSVPAPSASHQTRAGRGTSTVIPHATPGLPDRRLLNERPRSSCEGVTASASKVMITLSPAVEA
jgi:hypothetical protein